jgi:hypothetical protein
MGNGSVSRVVVYKGDDPFETAQEFCKLNKLDFSISEKVADFIK